MLNLYIKNVLLALYALALGFFLGLLFGGVLPFPWPYSVIVGYGIGLLAGIFVAFELLKKWQRPPLTKIIAALILLVVVAAVSEKLSLMTMQLMKISFSLMQ